MTQSIDRRRFLEQTAATTAAAAGISAAAKQVRAAESANEKVVVGVMGMSRGKSLAISFGKRPNVEIKYVCDVDSERANEAATSVFGAVNKKPQAITDFRRILEDKSVDALVCAAPNHWHAPSTIMACAAGKHVYVEKPCSHNPAEGEMMVAAARKHKRAVQMGSQRRSGPGTREAMQKLHEGAIGQVYLSRAFYNSLRGSIGVGKPAKPPSRLDYELWQGPAPRLPYMDNRVHYNWHWFWHWGNGELGNNGIHTLDLCRWGLDVDYPSRVTSSGGRYHFRDDQQTPDTHTVCFDFKGGKSISWQGLSCNKHGRDIGFVHFYGEKGAMELDQNGVHRIYDLKNDKQLEQSGVTSRGDVEHIEDFLAAIRQDTPLKLNSEIQIGHQSTLLCHLGNIAQRTGRTLNCGANGRIQGDPQAMKMWQRDYEDGWAPKV